MTLAESLGLRLFDVGIECEQPWVFLNHSECLLPAGVFRTRS